MILSFATQPIVVLALSATPLGPGLPDGWEVRAVRGQAAPSSEVRNEDGAVMLRIQGAGRAAWFQRKLPTVIAEAPGTLSWSWRVLESPRDADLRQKETDDSPIRIYVVFGTPNALSRSARVIFYTYGTDEPLGYARASHVSDRLHVVRRDGRSENGSWQDHEVDPFADYRRIWRRDPPPISLIGLMQDTDQTKALAVADLRRLEWVPSDARSQ